jgi:hypothetical protein
VPTVRAIVASADGDTAAAGRLAVGLAEPLRQLDTLAELVRRAHAGDDHARRAALELLATLVEALGSGHELVFDDTSRSAEVDDSCCCPDPRTPSTLSSVRSTALSQVGLAEQPYEPGNSVLLDQAALVDVMLQAAALFDSDLAAGTLAASAVVGLAAAATTMESIVDAALAGGESAVGDRINELGRGGKLNWLQQAPVSTAFAAPMMQVMSGGAPGGVGLPGGFGLPGGVGLPGGFGLPGRPGLPDLPGLPETPLVPGLPKRPEIDDIFELLKPRKPKWDPDDWCPTYPWWEYWRDKNVIDWREVSRIGCMIKAFRLLRERERIGELTRPLRPSRVTWSDGITAIEAGGACAGSTIVIRGQGFPAHGTAVLMMRDAMGCSPVAVAPAQWTSTAITVTLPPGVISGAVGFADAAYVAAYDSWAAEQNRLGDEIKLLGCIGTSSIVRIAPFRECPPLTPFNNLSAGDAIIDSFTANGLVDAFVEPGAGIQLAWTVRNAVNVRLERISADGPFFAGSTVLNNPAGTTYWLGAVSYNRPLNYVYRITATGPCGSAVREVRIAATRRPRLSIGTIEVTQSIQDTSNSVRLVQSKPTIVRVTVNHGLAGFHGDTVPNVRGRIRVRPTNGGSSGWIDAANGTNPMQPSPGARITVPATPQRGNTNDTLNFLIPPAWNSGTVRYEVEVRVDSYGTVGAFAGFAETVSRTTGTFSFQRRRTLELRYVRVTWNGSTPSHQVCIDTLRSAVPLLPTPTANIAALGGVGVQTPTSNDAGRDDLLDDFDDQHNCSAWEAFWEWAGADCPDDDGTIWVLIPGVFARGRAFDIPSNVCFTPPSNGPYAAHELSHCLNQRHVGLMCSNGQTAQGGDPASAWPNNAQLVDVPFDVTRNVALSLAGVGVFDVMTYCGTPNNTWPLPARWDRLWNEIGG